MNCPKCGTLTGVINSRDHLWRRRKCKSEACGHRFFTVETIVDERPDLGKPGRKPTAKSIERRNALPKKAPINVAKNGGKIAAPPRKSLPDAQFFARDSIVDLAQRERAQDANNHKANSNQPVFALKMPPGAAVRLGK